MDVRAKVQAESKKLGSQHAFREGVIMGITGSELVTDGGFDAVTAGTERIIDEITRVFSGAGSQLWTNNTMATFDTTGDLSVTNDGAGQTCKLDAGAAYSFVVGEAVLIEFDATIASGTFEFKEMNGTLITNVANGANSIYHNLTNATYAGFFIRGASGTGAADFDNFTIKPITFTNWTAGTGYAPQATAGSLTGKAQKIAGTASDLTQTGTPAVANKIYRVIHTATRDNGTLTPEFGSNDGVAISAAGTYYDYITTIDTDYPKFKADATFAGTIDSASIKQIKYFDRVPTWVYPIEERYNVFISPLQEMKKDYYLFSTTPILQYRIEFVGVTEGTYRAIQQQWRDVSGVFSIFLWNSVPSYIDGGDGLGTSMQGRWFQSHQTKALSKAWNVTMFFEKDIP